MTPRLLLATRNPGKAREYSLLLQGVPFELTSLADEGIQEEVVENGATLEDNAKLKALRYALSDSYLVIGDDSGLEVDALGGLPGPMSARFAGEGASDSDRIARLLERIQDIPIERRTARFRCIIAIGWMERVLAICEGECPGIIGIEPRGQKGFGYDPIFYLPDMGKTMAELSIDEKNRVSHRGKAARKAVEVLRNIREEFAE